MRNQIGNDNPREREREERRVGSSAPIKQKEGEVAKQPLCILSGDKSKWPKRGFKEGRNRGRKEEGRHHGVFMHHLGQTNPQIYKLLIEKENKNIEMSLSNFNLSCQVYVQLRLLTFSVSSGTCS